jgi:hypothetical protein
MATSEQVIKAAIAQLNEILAEVVAKVAEDDEFALMACTHLKRASWALGFEFRGERGDPDLFLEPL